MMLLSQAAKAVQGRVEGGDVRFGSISTDTRMIVQGDLFIALRGEKFDGARFVADALKAGAVAAVVNVDSRELLARSLPSGSPILYVEDTRLALGKLAAHWRSQFDIPLVAITGSNGKTTVKEMLAAILRQKIKDDFHDRSLTPREITGDLPASGSSRMASSSIRVGEREGDDADQFVLATKGNFNNDIGMPLTLLKLRETHRYAVIEMGMNHPNEIDYLTHIARPDVALVNNATGAHLQGLGSVEGVARAKGEIFAGLRSQGTAVINADDAHAALWRTLAGTHRIFEFALEHPAAVKGEWQVQGYGGSLHVRTPAGEMSLVLQVPGEHNARNALAAATAALALQIPLTTIVKGLEGFGGVDGRLQRKRALQDATLIDDTYNANPASVHAALEVLAQAQGKRIFVLGDMGELGDAAAQFHREIGIAARELGIDRLFALGTLSIEPVREFSENARHFETIEARYEALDKELDAQTTVLVKGSRFMKMERIVAHCTGQEEACCSH
jgi:UDP-N-acetylmuramoyl-tripeptide--D-alanyl-D-alanine ligase